MTFVCLYVYEYALLERSVYVLCFVSCLSFLLLIYVQCRYMYMNTHAN